MRGSSAALLAKDSACRGASSVATNAGLGFRYFSPNPSQSAPEASNSVFLMERVDDVPPNNQLGAKQLVAPEYTSVLAQLEGLRLPEVALLLPLSKKMKMQTAYALLRTLRQFCWRTQAFLIPWLRWSIDDARSPCQVPSPESSWQIPQLPLNALSLHGNQFGEER